MKAEDWPRVEELFHNAERLGAAERDAYLARECAGDVWLRREVEALVSASESNPSFMERPLLSVGLRAIYGGTAASLAGSSLGHYQILRLLDGGGMGGEVYLAEDCRLGRHVALKFISNHYAGDEWAREQMLKEARAVARLDHAHICPVHAVEEIGGHHFIVMQYVEGETLAALMRRERIALPRVTELAEQIAGALAFAHARGVIHRDVKPQNIMVTPDGQARVLDFGLAKFVRPQRGEGLEGGADPGQTLQLGDVVGTPAYMSPEQARGEGLDFRSDIYSFGVVLYEMLSGRNPFLRDTVEETLSAVRSENPPPLSISPAGAPGVLGEIALDCLAKERARRPESADALVKRLRGLRQVAGAAPGLTPEKTKFARFPRLRRHARSLAAAALALALLLSTVIGYFYLSRPEVRTLRVSGVPTLAVLPIANVSGGEEGDRLSRGLTRVLYDKFSYLPRLRLRLPSDAAPGDSEIDGLLRAGREMKADAVLFGEILTRRSFFTLRTSPRLRLSLLDTANASRLWDATFDLDSADLFALQDDITREVAARLGLRLVGDERELLTKRQTNSEEALSLYMYGRYEWGQRKNPADMQKAIGYFEQAVAKDPSFAKAYAGLADCYALRNNVAYGPVGTKEALEKASFNARRAVEAGDSLPEAHTSLGLVKLRYEWDWAGAEREFKRAIELDPDYAPAHFWYSNLLAAMRRFEEGIREAEVAKSLDPYSPLAQQNYALAFHYARRYDEAEALLRGMLERYPGYPQFQHLLALVLMQQGRYDEAIERLEQLRATNPRYADASLGYAYGKVGRTADAYEMLGEIERLSTPENPMPAQERAIVYIGIGDRDKAFETLEEVYKERFAGLAFLAAEPGYDSLRGDPRFTDLARRVNLTP